MSNIIQLTHGVMCVIHFSWKGWGTIQQNKNQSTKREMTFEQGDERELGLCTPRWQKGDQGSKTSKSEMYRHENTPSPPLASLNRWSNLLLQEKLKRSFRSCISQLPQPFSISTVSPLFSKAKFSELLRNPLLLVYRLILLQRSPSLSFLLQTSFWNHSLYWLSTLHL